MYADQKSKTEAVICTIPRSGTNLVEYFMRYLGFFLFAKQKDWDSEECVFDSVATNRKTHRQLFPSVGHGYCPGYREFKSNIWYDKWSQIPESDNWFNAIQENFKNNSLFDLSQNKTLKVVFIYRNIYDCILSLYDHLRNHINYNLSNTSLEDLTLTVVPQFIKNYVSFREMKTNYPDSILFVSYEELILDRKKCLLQICHFCELDKLYDNDNFFGAFDKACDFTEISKMKKLENFMEKSLAGDQRFYDTSNSHIRAIDRKSQRKNISSELVSKIELILAEYDINEFSCD
jgi:hypothetical protein